MDWLNKNIGLIDSKGSAHTWSKFGEALKSQQNNQRQEEFIPDSIIAKKPVFNIRAAFWITVIIVGGSYMLIEKVSYEGAVNKAIDFINEEIEKEEYTTIETPEELKLVTDTDIGFEMKIPQTMLIKEDDRKGYVSIVNSEETRNIDSRWIIVTKIDNSIYPNYTPHTEKLVSEYSGVDYFTLKEVIDTELNNLPAKKYVYEFGNAESMFGAVDVVLEDKDILYRLRMSDVIPDFNESLSEFEKSRESFVLK